MVPSKCFLTKGVGRDREKLMSFEKALRDAGIEKYNLVYVSSIFAPKCEIITRDVGLLALSPGQIVHCVMARSDTNEPNRQIASAIGLAIPADRETYGYISEHHTYGQTDETAGEYSEDLAATMLAGTLGVDFDPNSAYDERKEIFQMSGKIVKTTNCTQSARGDKNGLWTTTIACVVFVEYRES